MENLSSKAVLVLVLTTVIGMAVTGTVTWLIATSGAGIDAAERDRIIAVYEAEQVLDDGRTVKQVLSTLDKNYRVLANDVENIDENLDLIRQAMEAIASE